MPLRHFISLARNGCDGNFGLQSITLSCQVKNRELKGAIVAQRRFECALTAASSIPLVMLAFAVEYGNYLYDRE